MAYQNYRLGVFLYVVLLFISAPVCNSQQNRFDKQGNLFSLVNNKVDSLLDNDFTLMNARFHINKYPRANGKPFFETTYDTPGKLVLGKKEYNDIRLMYDIHDQKLSFVVEQNGYNGTILELNNQVITRFYLDNKIFVNSFELPILTQTGFYEEIFLGKHLKVYARWSKDYVDRITMQNIGEFTSQKRKLFFEINGKMVDISSRKRFLKIFAEERNKINSFMKENKIRLFKSNNTDIIKLFSYSDSFLLRPLLAQTDSVKISYSGSNVAFSKFVDDIEISHHIKFYYDPQWVDSLIISVNFNNLSIGQALNQILQNESLHYYSDNDGNIIITKSNIKTELSYKWVTGDSSKRSSPYNSANSDNIIEKYTYFDDKNKIEEISFGVKNSKGNATLTGYIKDLETGEPLIGAYVFIDNSNYGATADVDGYYRINIKCGTYKIGFKTLGMTTIFKKVNLYSNGNININLSKDIVALKEVVITESKNNNVKGNQLGFEKLSVKEIKELPYAAGERDILKASLLLPGVQTVGESSSGINVRGGAADQNLFIINNVPIFNTSHMLGMFSAFNADLIKDFELYKSSIPIEYGGRISSVFDIRSKQGNKNGFSMKGGISPVTGRLLFEGPLIQDKSSFIIGIRSTYSNWLLHLVENPDVSHSDIYFNDITANLNYEINENNQLSLFTYYSIDNYTLVSNVNYNYSNIGSSLNWKHIFNRKLYSRTSAVYSNYNLKETNKFLSDYKYIYKHQLKYFEINQSFNYAPMPNHELKFGFNSILYQINPGAFNPVDSSNYQEKTFEGEKALESAIYLGDTYDITPKLSVSGGLRFSQYNYLGEKTVFSYLQNEPLSAETVIDSTVYPNFKIIKSYSGLDIRFSSRYLINDNNSIKVGYSHNNQYVFMLTNTISISPTDRWKLCDPFSKPIIGEQYNLGYYRSLNKNNYDVSFEIYYKENKNVSDYKNGADLVHNQNIERDILSGNGRNYGFEFMIKKNIGKFTGWFNYFYSKSEFQFKGNTDEETINSGNYYPSNYDKPHNINIVANYRNRRRVSISANFVYSTGRPYTGATFLYSLDNHDIVNYSERNQLRVPDYYRLDLSLNIDGNLFRRKLAHSFWTVTVYNLTGRRNAYSVFTQVKDGSIKTYMVSIYSVPVFSVSYNFKLGNYYSN